MDSRVKLEVESLTLSYGQNRVLKDVSFELHRGEVLGIAGLMGAGRTELLETLFGSANQTPTGEVLLDGKRVQFRHPSDAMRAGMALVTEDRKRLGLFSQLSVADNVTICTLRDTVR